MTPRYSATGKKEAMAIVRQRLIEAAIQEFAQKGYDGANVNTISLTAGFSKGTIYNMTSAKQIPHFKKGRRNYFDKHEIDAWLREDRRKTNKQLHVEAEMEIRKR